MRKDIKNSDWDLLQDWIDTMEPDKLLLLTEKTKKFSPTQQIKLLRSAAEKLREREGSDELADRYATRQGEECMEDALPETRAEKEKRAKCKTLQGTEKFEDAED